MELSQCKPLGLDMLMQANSPSSDIDRLKFDHVTTTKYIYTAGCQQTSRNALNGSRGGGVALFHKGEERNTHL